MADESPIPPIDGDAASLAPGPLADVLDLGGPVVWILLALSVVAVAITLFKTVEISLAGRGRRQVSRALVEWRSGKPEAALAAVGSARQGLPALVSVAMRGRQGGASDALMREELQRMAGNHLHRLRSHLRSLEVIGQISPLLGLFGTVLGMIEAFRRMEEAGARVDPAVLSGGIWQALLTTGVGLAVAIPTVMAHQWLERRTDAQAHRIEDAVTQVFTSDLGRPLSTVRGRSPHHAA